MDTRIAAIEGRIKHVEGTLDELKLAVLRLPTTGNLWTMVASVLGVALAMVGIVVALTGPFARTETVREVPAASAPLQPQIIYIQPPSAVPATTPAAPIPQTPPAE